MDPTLTDEDIGVLFINLPQRCVILLEDIDSAGLIKRQELKKTRKTEDDNATGKAGTEIANALIYVQEKDSRSRNISQGISLLGLLNVIDDVAAHEGRVLIMITNNLENLDDALIRSGRIDMQVKFTMATSSQIRELFINMYSDETPATKELEDMASEFALCVPGNTFTPAHIQGFLLPRKTELTRAIEEAVNWVAEIKEEESCAYGDR